MNEFTEKYFGKYMGYVRDDADPEKRGRLRVFCPEVLGGTDSVANWLDWALPQFPWFASLGVGSNFVPPRQKDWGVWIEFRHGDPRFPIWTGVFPLVAIDKTTTTIDASATVKLGTNAAQKAVRGDVFKVYNDAHFHGSPFGPTSPPSTPLPTNALSAKVRVE